MLGDSYAVSRLSPICTDDLCPAFLTQYSLKLSLDLLSRSTFGLSAGKAEEVGAGGHANVPRFQVMFQETPTRRRVTGACGEKLRAGNEETGR